VCLDRHNLELKIVKCEPENSNSIQAEHEHLQSEIKNLQAFKVNPNITINFKGLPTMVDGKVVSALTNLHQSLKRDYNLEHHHSTLDFVHLKLCYTLATNKMLKLSEQKKKKRKLWRLEQLL